MKLIIDIDEKEYNECKNLFSMIYQEGYLNYNLNTALVMYIANGTPFEDQKVGHWILREEWFDDEEKPRLTYGCDRCGFSLKNSHEKRWFCPNCGAKMENENRNNL